MQPRYYTNSELGVMRDCPRRWYLSNYRRLSNYRVSCCRTRGHAGEPREGGVADIQFMDGNPSEAEMVQGSNRKPGEEDLRSHT